MKYTIKNFKKQFPTQESCLEYVFSFRYGYSFPCPQCKKASWHRIRGRKAWACAYCAYQIHPVAGTIFHKSDTDLTLWFFALYKFANSRNGVSAKELERDLGVTYKTAWRIAKQIRKLMEMNDLKMGGIVEVDESFMDKVSKHGTRTQTPKALGIVQRGGAAKAVVIRKAGIVNVLPLIRNEVGAGTNLFTDSAKLYGSHKLSDYNHNAVNHSIGEYVSGQVHTNSVDGFFSQIKRSISGTYHQVSEKYLQNYLDEFSWRLTHSRSGIPLFLLLLRQLCQLPYVED